MEKIISKKLIRSDNIKYLLFLFCILAYSILHTLFLRLKLPAYGASIGTYLDDISYAMVVALILVFIFNLPSLLRKTCLFIFVFFVQFLVLAEWWNYEFYRDYIRYSSLGHVADIQEIFLGFEGFQNRYLALSGMLVFLLIAFVLERKSALLTKTWRVRFSSLSILLVMALVPTVAYTQFYKLSQIENWYLTTAIPLNYKNPVLQLVREKFVDKVQVAKVTPLHISSINQLYDNENTIYPFYQEEMKIGEPKVKNIMFITLESVRKFETIPRNGIDLTPNFNQIAANNFTPKYYYANSNQTIKAEIALLCGMHDFLVGTSISAANNQQVKTNCLPELLKQFGYHSYWFHGAMSDFFNRDQFLPKIGFSELHDQATIQNELIKQGKSYVLRHWGIEDPYTFDYALDYLEDVDEPFFAEILSVSNHHPFANLNLNPEEDYYHPGILREEDDVYNRYQHMTNYTDKALGKFWRSFENSHLYKNTIVVISGDHGIWLFPSTEGQAEDGQPVFQYELYLRLPLTIYFPEKSFSGEIDTTLSQVDVAELILSQLNLPSNNAFQTKLDQAVITKMMNGKITSEDFVNPVFSSIGDNFYYRNGNVVCYPPIETESECDDYLRRCVEEHNVLKTDKICVSLDEDILFNSQSKVEQILDYDTETPNIVADYFRKSIYFGAMPETAIISSMNR